MRCNHGSQNHLSQLDDSAKLNNREIKDFTSSIDWLQGKNGYELKVRNLGLQNYAKISDLMRYQAIRIGSHEDVSDF